MPHETDEWSKATHRSGEPWTAAEERRLQRLYAKPRRVKWMGRWRTKAMYRAAKALGRTPCACAQRMNILSSFKRRK